MERETECNERMLQGGRRKRVSSVITHTHTLTERKTKRKEVLLGRLEMKQQEKSKIVHWFYAAACRMEKHSGHSGLQGHDDCEGRLSGSHRLSLDTNLFDVITSLGTGLYVHHIELTSFPLCRLDRNLPVTVPGRDGER